ncbi:endonuclease domain-containing 1 protein-like [Lampris incognitus]|uniref:endonuclease domain-containing 1 protein-like n=1 Tax=Lampris incognitus TaxID=2546036 RepID=UPI0024B5F99C|nr:endonuclease domain-containing 1 protein-like [Lampris incognitus]
MPPSCKGALLLLLACLGGLALGEVGNFSPCLNFFYRERPPWQGIGTKQNNNLAEICQFYKNQYSFASLYHKKRRTPLYSAYILFTVRSGKRPDARWMYEPQLENPRGSREMTPFPTRKPKDKIVFDNRAVPADYTNSTYTKGHLNPSAHNNGVENQKATFTLTNIVPQRNGSNCGPWNHLETEVKQRLEKYCDGLAYVITGVIPYRSENHYIKERVAVPEYLWSAYCCPRYRAKLPESEQTHFPTYAAVGKNDHESDDTIVPVNETGYDVSQMPLEILECILKRRLDMHNTSLFHKQCRED